jgi:hypothetical protein
VKTPSAVTSNPPAGSAEEPEPDAAMEDDDSNGEPATRDDLGGAFRGEAEEEMADEEMAEEDGEFVE